MDHGASLIAVLLLLVVVAVVVHNNDAAADAVDNYTEKEENTHPDKTGNAVAEYTSVAASALDVDVVTLLASSAIAPQSAALRAEIVLVTAAEVAVVHDYREIPIRHMAIVKAEAGGVCHDLSWWRATIGGSLYCFVDLCSLYYKFQINCLFQHSKRDFQHDRAENLKCQKDFLHV